MPEGGGFSWWLWVSGRRAFETARSLVKFRIFRLFLSCCHIRGDNSATLSSEVTGAGLPVLQHGPMAAASVSPGARQHGGSAESRGDAGLHSPEARGESDPGLAPQGAADLGGVRLGLPSTVAAAAEPGVAGFVGGRRKPRFAE